MIFCCLKCNHINNYEIDDSCDELTENVLCYNCLEIIKITKDKVFNVHNSQIEPQTQEFENGDLVIIKNEQHVWHNEVAIVRDYRHPFYRLEMMGFLNWVPSHWVLKINDAI